MEGNHQMTVISHEPATGMYKIHFSRGRVVSVEADDLATLGRLITATLSPVEDNTFTLGWRRRLEEKYGFTQGDLV